MLKWKKLQRNFLLNGEPIRPKDSSRTARAQLAYAANPERFVRGLPKRSFYLVRLWINPPAHDGIGV